MGEKSAKNILAGIESSKNIPFERVLFGMGIRYVGETVAKKLARAFGSMDKLMEASREELLQVDEIGEVIADSLIDYFGSQEHRKLIQELKDSGLQLQSSTASEKQSNKLQGLTFVISGVFSKMSRDEAKDLIEANGGKCSGSVSSKTHYLLAGEGMGPAKLQKAEELGVKIIGEDDLLKMLDGSAPAKDETPVQGSLF